MARTDGIIRDVTLAQTLLCVVCQANQFKLKGPPDILYILFFFFFF